MEENFAAVVLAAGLGRRFGGDKLLAECNGKKLFERALGLLDNSGLSPVAVVSGTEEILSEACHRGFLPVENRQPEKGVSLSIRLGLEAVNGSAGALFLVADQPLLTQISLKKILLAAQTHPGYIIVPESENGDSGNPCFFPASFYDELKALCGDTGGKKVIRTHPEHLFPVTIPAEELLDTDTKEELARLSYR